jgi:AcrR family transcriptional regulator
MPARELPAADARGRRALIDATVAAIEEDGLAGTTLRAITRRACVSHAAPAHHFGDKAGLFTAVAVEGFALLDARLTEALAGAGDDALDRMQVLAEAYIGFAREHRAHFEVMFRPELLTEGDPDLVAAGLTTFGRLQATVQEVQDQGYGADWSLDELTLAAWSTVHGIVQLAVHGVLGQVGLPVDPVAVASRLTHLLGQAIASR